MPFRATVWVQRRAQAKIDPMGLLEYRFKEHWHLPAPVDAVYEVLADLASYPQWWPQVRSVEGIDGDGARLVCRSVLPYSLRFDALRGREDRAAGILEARLAGDLVGFSRWTVRPHPAGTELVYDQHVTTPRGALKWLAPAARPLLVLNHQWMMRSGRKGLETRLRTTG
jgi:hypothetical protein